VVDVGGEGLTDIFLDSVCVGVVLDGVGVEVCGEGVGRHIHRWCWCWC